MVANSTSLSGAALLLATAQKSCCRGWPVSAKKRPRRDVHAGAPPASLCDSMSFLYLHEQPPL